jgi:hypothetical protein
MASAQVELQDLIHGTLMNDAVVMALVDGIYDRVPANAFGPRKAYVSFGPSDVIEDDAECIVGGTHTFQIDCWSRAYGQVACKQIVDAVKNALHERDLELADNALVEIRVDFRRVMEDPDGLTTHGVVTVTAMIEEYP